MTTTCLVSNYNYANFIGQAVDSALGQTLPFDEIIVVDDGSTDGSVDLLASRYAESPTIHVVSKPNGGQLSCFNEGFAGSRGDVVFFLDADDVYEPRYLEKTLDVYRRHPSVDFVFCGHRKFGRCDSVHLPFADDRDLGYSVILTAYLGEWIGAPTSCLSMRRHVLEKILPLPFADDWRTRADDCLVFGASLAGARKYCVAQPLVRYRVHGDNHFCGRSADRFATYRRRLAINALFGHLERKLCYNVRRLAEFHHREFCTIGRPSLRQLALYVGINMRARASLLRRLACLAEMAGHYLRTAIWPAGGAENRARAVDRDSTGPLHVFVPTNSAADVDAKRPRVPQRHAA
ncbi:MAG: glycosyltransferase [Pirellulales bacterium]